MALVLDDRVRETSSTTGTGTLNLDGAVSGFQTFVAGVGNSNTTYYAIVHRTEAEWELGVGTVTDASTDTLARTTVISSSNSDSAVDFSAGTKDVFVTQPSSKAVYEDANADVTLPDDLILGSDSAVLKFGADSDTTLTHTDGTGLTLNSTNKLTFQDTGTYIYSNADGDLDLVSDGTAVDSINVESAGGITLDAGTAGSGIVYEDDGTEMARIYNSSSNVILETKVSDKDFSIKGNDGGSAITALSLDMSAAGAATFNDKVIATELDISGNMDIDGTSNLDAVDIDGAVQLDATLTVGADDQGYDIKFFGDTASAYMLWDTSADDLVLAGDAGIDLAGDIDVDGTANLDNTDIDGTLAVDGTTISLDATTSLNIDNSNTSNGITIGTATSGVPISIGHTTSEVTINDNLTVTGTLTLGSNAELTEAELEMLDGITAGTVAASKAVVVDSNKDAASFRNVTLTGELDAATLDISGNADIDGTTNLDAVDIDGAVQLDATFTVGEDDTGYDVKFFGATSGAYMLWDESTDDLVLAGAAKLYLYDAAGGESLSSDGTDLTINAGTDLNLTAGTDINIPADVGLTFGNDAEKIEGDGTDLTISGNNINLTATADVNIPSGVGVTFATAEKIESDGTDLTITVGSGGDINIPADIGMTFGNDGEKIEGDGTDLTISGNNINLTATADVVIPNNVGIQFGGASEKIEGDGTDLTISANNLTVDAAADIILDAAGNNLTFKSGGTSILDIANNSSDVELTVSVADKNFAVKGTDGASAITALDIDMAAAGKATFNDAVVVGGDLTVNGTTTTVNSTTMTVDDPIITLGGDSAPGSDDNKDRGVEFRYHDGSSARIGFMGYDDSATAFTFLTAASNSSEVFSGTAAKLVAGELDISGDVAVGDDLSLDSDAAVLNFGADSDVNLTHVADTGLLLNGAMVIQFRDSGLTVGSNADGDLDIVSDGTAVDSINIESAGGITLDAGTAGSGVIYEDDGTEMLRIHNSSSDVIVESKVSNKDIIFKVNDGGSSTEVARIDGDVSAFLMASGKELRFADSGEKISGDGTDLTLNSGADINLTATADINVPADVGITFGDDAEKIEGDGTDLTVTGNNIKLTATADVVLAANTGLVLDGSGNEKIESDGTDISISVGSGGDINIPADIGMTFGNDGEKIEGDGTDLTISGNNINLTATADVVIPANVGITFGSGEKIEGDSTDLTITSGADIALTATADVNVPANVGMTFGDDGEKIEGDGTDLTIASSGVINLAAGGSTNQIKVTDGAILPITDDDVDLGSSSYQFKNGYFDGTLEADAITIAGTAVTAGGATTADATALAIALG